MSADLSSALNTAQKNFQTIDNLLEIHKSLTQGVQGRNKHLTPSLLQAILVNLCAYWEAYIEDVCIEGAQIICDNVDSGLVLSEKMKARIGNQVKQDKDDKSPWRIYGDGWKEIFQQQVRQKCLGDGINDFGLNTPSYQNVKDLTKLIFDIDNIGEWWTWQGQIADDAKNKLGTLLQRRALVAHGKPVGSLNVNQCKNYYNTIHGIIHRTNDAISARLYEICSK